MMRYRSKEQFAERRKRIIDLVKSGWGIKSVAKHFNVGTAEIYRILRLERSKGNL